MRITSFFRDARKTDGNAGEPVEIFCSFLPQENCLQSQSVVSWLVCDTDRFFMSSNQFIPVLTGDRREIFNLLGAQAAIFQYGVRHVHS